MERIGSNRINELVSRAVSGDGNAFTALWDEYIASLRSLIKSWDKTLDDLYVDDICSRSFEKAFRQIGTYDPSKSQFFTWLRTIARNTAFDLLAGERRRRNLMVSMDEGGCESSPQVAETIPDGVESPLDSIIRSEDRVETEMYISRLSPLYRDIAGKRLIEGMPYKEIAEATGLELNTVRTRIRRAKAFIEAMRAEEED
ncbi:MAG: RNA polymerase sigma factor [Bacteroidia bacterium]|nr:RNA polymerase sigma factor [Bacteroidia bacterium]